MVRLALSQSTCACKASATKRSGTMVLPFLVSAGTSRLMVWSFFIADFCPRTNTKTVYPLVSGIFRLAAAKTTLAFKASKMARIGTRVTSLAT